MAEDCSCTDTTEPSNATSLRSDIGSVLNSDVVCTETVDRRNDSVKDASSPRADTDCKCPPDRASYCVPTATEAIPAKPDRKIQQTNSRSQPLMIPTIKTSQFLPGFPCLCHSHKINGYVLPMKLKKEKAQPRQFWSRFNWKRSKSGYFGKEDKVYEIKLKQTQCPRYSKKRANDIYKQQLNVSREYQSFTCCEMPKGIPNTDDKQYDSLAKTKPAKYQTKMKPKREKAMEKIEIYYFDHGNSAYYRTTDCHPVLTTDKCVEKTDQAATRFWAEIFGTIHIGTAFVTAFILQLLRFVLYSVIRPLTVGILQMIVDYFVKPLLSIVFNAIVQPTLILFYNIATSVRDLCEPIAEAMGLFLREIANLCAAIRIVEVKHVHAPATACT